MTTEGMQARRHEGTVRDCQLLSLAASPPDGVDVIRADAVACREESGAPLKRVKLSPANTIASKNGTFIVDAESWKAIEREFSAHGTSLEIDLEHESLRSDLTPKDRLGAVGWIESLSFDEANGLFANVRWNEEGRTRIQGDRFRYISPVFIVSKADRRVLRVKSAGLVNEPAIPNQERLAAKEGFGPLVSGNKETDMELQKELQKCLGAADTDTAEVLVNKVGELAKRAKTADVSAGTVKAVCKALGVAETASEAEIVVAINTAKQSKDAATAMQGELTLIKNKLAERDAEDRMRPHIVSNKINPNATEDVAICKKLAAENPEAFERLMKERQPYVAAGRTTPPEGPAKTGGGAKEQEMIANSVKAHGNNYGKGIVALQEELMRPHLSAGLTTKAARQRCVHEYPAIFAD